MRNEIILKRTDGSRVKLIARFGQFGIDSGNYRVDVHICAPRKRTGSSTYDTDDYRYRRCSMSERREWELKSQLEYVTEAEIYQAKLELWNSLKPEE